MSIETFTTASAGKRRLASPTSWRDSLESLLGFGLLSGIVSAVVAAAALAIPSSSTEFFAWSWGALWIVAIATIIVTGRGAFALANYLAPRLARRLENRRRRLEDARFLASARLDNRLMADIDGAIRRSDWR